MHKRKENEMGRQFIGISGDRLKHILGVSRKAYRFAKDRGHDENFARKMFIIIQQNTPASKAAG